MTPPPPSSAGRAAGTAGPRRILIASDSTDIRNEVKSVLSSDRFVIQEVTAGAQVLPAVKERLPDLLVCDLQIGNMGGVAVVLDLRLEESGDRVDHVPVLLLLDRRADVFLARRCEAEGWIVKPVDPIRLRRGITEVLDGDTFEDDTYRPANSAAVVRPSGSIATTGK